MSLPKVFTCQDLEFELFMNSAFRERFRTSTPITEETDAAFAEKKRAKKHFLYLISLILQTSEHPSYPYVSIPTTPPSQNFPIFGSTTVIYNRMNAELARKQAYANIYSGPISNRGFAPIHFQH